MAYSRVTDVERRLLRMWRQAGYGQREIAWRLNRSPSSICSAQAAPALSTGRWTAAGEDPEPADDRHAAA